MRIGVDVGGTKIEAIALGRGGEPLRRRRLPTPRHDYTGTIAAMATLVETFEDDLGERATIGIGIPGAISPATGLVKNANSTWLNGQPLQHDLEQRLGRPVRLANDANCFALSEAVDGAGAGADVVFGVILGTGTGAGIVCGGRPIVGRNAIGGEWGHNPLPWPRDDERPGPSCYCGLHGCIETFLSGPAVSIAYTRQTGIEVSAEGVVERALSGEGEAEQVLQAYEDRMARALATVINLIDPDVIVLGGGLSNIDRLYANVPGRWASYVFSDRVDTPLVKARHGDSSGVRGAAWLWND